MVIYHNVLLNVIEIITDIEIKKVITGCSATSNLKQSLTDHFSSVRILELLAIILKLLLAKLSPTCSTYVNSKLSLNFTGICCDQGWGVGVKESDSGHFWGFRSWSRQKLADSDSSKTLYCFFIKTIASKVWFSSISRKFATEKEFIFNGKDAVCITRLPQQLDVSL